MTKMHLRYMIYKAYLEETYWWTSNQAATTKSF